jgi:hypothetical protein
MNVKKNIKKTSTKNIKTFKFKPCEKFSIELLETNDPRKWNALAEKLMHQYDVENLTNGCDPDQRLVDVMRKTEFASIQNNWRYREKALTMTVRDYCLELKKEFLGGCFHGDWGYGDYNNRKMNDVLKWWRERFPPTKPHPPDFHSWKWSEIYAYFLYLADVYENTIQPLLDVWRPALDVFKANLKRNLPDTSYNDGCIFVKEKKICLIDLIKLLC